MIKMLQFIFGLASLPNDVGLILYSIALLLGDACKFCSIYDSPVNFDIRFQLQLLLLHTTALPAFGFVVSYLRSDWAPVTDDWMVGWSVGYVGINLKEWVVVGWVWMSKWVCVYVCLHITNWGAAKVCLCLKNICMLRSVSEWVNKWMMMVMQRHRTINALVLVNAVVGAVFLLRPELKQQQMWWFYFKISILKMGLLRSFVFLCALFLCSWFLWLRCCSCCCCCCTK